MSFVQPKSARIDGVRLRFELCASVLRVRDCTEPCVSTRIRDLDGKVWLNGHGKIASGCRFWPELALGWALCAKLRDTFASHKTRPSDP